MYTRHIASLTLLAAAGLLSACGGGGGGDGYNPPPMPERQAPQVRGLADQSINQDTPTPALAFQISDGDSGTDRLNVVASSSDTNVIPNEGIVLGGSGGSRTIQLTPMAEAIGAATITVRATDPDGMAGQMTFRVQVNGVYVSFRSLATEMFATGENDDQHTLWGFTVQRDADDDPAAFDALLQ
ncbi:MAG TPA: hypothetical protein VKB34_14200 [Povalibacter sp.]|nr:hypothetical protein [Povalibacter sp.]